MLDTTSLLVMILMIEIIFLFIFFIIMNKLKNRTSSLAENILLDDVCEDDGIYSKKEQEISIDEVCKNFELLDL